MSDKPRLLQMFPLSTQLEAGLAAHFEVHRLFADPDADAWIDAHGGEVVAVATGGHIGISTPLMERLPALGIVAVNGVGVDKIDLEVARLRSVRVTTTPDVLTDDVADLALGLIIALLRYIRASDRFIRNGDWPRGARPLTRRVSGLRFGVVGLGRIGKAVASRLGTFGPVAYTGPTPKSVAYPFAPSVPDLARDSDVLILASAASASNAGMNGAEVFDPLGPEGIFVNVARGSLVDEGALIAALQEGRIGGATLDVFADEPHVPEALKRLDNVVLTPHAGSATTHGRGAMADLVLENLLAFLHGRPLPAALI